MISAQTTDFIQKASSFVREADGRISEQTRILTEWDGHAAKFRLVNEGQTPVSVKEMVLFKGGWPYTGDTKFYGEGYSMLSQYGGTIAQPGLIGKFDDRKHYKLPATEGFFTAYNFVLLSPSASSHVLMGFTSCSCYTGEIRLADGHFEVVLDGEQLIIEPGQSWELESFAIFEGTDRETLLEQFGREMEANHPRLETPGAPNGWCSWYCFGPQVTEQNIFDNLHAISEQAPQLKYIQIDDGYQAYMGDWLVPGKSFSDMEKLCKQIKAEGFEPAIWVAPFIAQQESALFQEHRDWFIQDEDGQPLASNKISFGGWRHGPWYMLDGTHPEAREYLRQNTALAEHEIDTEVDRYIAWPGQALSYYLGELEIRQDRARAEKALGDKFDIRAFHDAVLSTGSVPLPVLHKRIDQFIAGGGKSPYAQQ